MEHLQAFQPSLGRKSENVPRGTSTLMLLKCAGAAEKRRELRRKRGCIEKKGGLSVALCTMAIVSGIAAAREYVVNSLGMMH